MATMPPRRRQPARRRQQAASENSSAGANTSAVGTAQRPPAPPYPDPDAEAAFERTSSSATYWCPADGTFMQDGQVNMEEARRGYASSAVTRQKLLQSLIDSRENLIAEQGMQDVAAPYAAPRDYAWAVMPRTAYMVQNDSQRQLPKHVINQSEATWGSIEELKVSSRKQTQTARELMYLNWHKVYDAWPQRPRISATVTKATFYGNICSHATLRQTPDNNGQYAELLLADVDMTPMQLRVMGLVDGSDEVCPACLAAAALHAWWPGNTC